MATSRALFVISILPLSALCAGWVYQSRVVLALLLAAARGRDMGSYEKLWGLVRTCGDLWELTENL